MKIGVDIKYEVPYYKGKREITECLTMDLGFGEDCTIIPHEEGQLKEVYIWLPEKEVGDGL